MGTVCACCKVSLAFGGGGRWLFPGGEGTAPGCGGGGLELASWVEDGWKMLDGCGAPVWIGSDGRAPGCAGGYAVGLPNDVVGGGGLA